MKNTPGNKTRSFVLPDGTIVVLPILPITALKGIAKTPRRHPICLEEMEEGIAEGFTQRERTRER